jgi:hypothetical protein
MSGHEKRDRICSDKDSGEKLFKTAKGRDMNREKSHTKTTIISQMMKELLKKVGDKLETKYSKQTN